MNKRERAKEKDGETSFEKIIDIAFDLFLEHGYEDTTIRMITEKAGIHIGSLYYLFPNKESILQAMMLTIFDTIHKNARVIYDDKNSLTTLLYPTASLLYMASQSKHIARLLYKAYSTWSVFEELLKFSKNWALNFDSSLLGIDDREYHARLLFIFGGLGNTLGEIYHSKRTIDYHERLDEFIAVACRVFERPVPDDIKITKKSLYALLENEKITLLGKEIATT